MKKVLTFIGFFLCSCIILVSLVALVFGMGFEDDIYSNISCVLLLLIYAFMFFKFRPKSCNVYVLPISVVLFIFNPPIRFVDIEYYYSSWLFFILTLVISIFITIRNKKKVEVKQGESE